MIGTDSNEKRVVFPFTGKLRLFYPIFPSQILLSLRSVHLAWDHIYAKRYPSTAFSSEDEEDWMQFFSIGQICKMQLDPPGAQELDFGCITIRAKLLQKDPIDKATALTFRLEHPNDEYLNLYRLLKGDSQIH